MADKIVKVTTQTQKYYDDLHGNIIACRALIGTALDTLDAANEQLALAVSNYLLARFTAPMVIRADDCPEANDQTDTPN